MGGVEGGGDGGGRWVQAGKMGTGWEDKMSGGRW